MAVLVRCDFENIIMLGRKTCLWRMTAIQSINGQARSEVSEERYASQHKQDSGKFAPLSTPVNGYASMTKLQVLAHMSGPHANVI